MSDLSIAIDLNLSPVDNMHAIISNAALEEIPKGSYRLSNPKTNQEGGTNYNTTVVITSTSNHYSGSDTHYYHRPDIGLIGGEVVNGITFYNKPIPEKVGVDNLTEVCRVLGIMPSEFTLTEHQMEDNEAITHLLTARENSYLYTGMLAIRVGEPLVKNTDPVVIAETTFAYDYIGAGSYV